MVSNITLKKIEFLVLIALIVFGSSMLANFNKIDSSVRIFIGAAGLILIVVVTFKFGQSFKADKKPEGKDVFDYTSKDTSPAVLGKLSELKYSGRRQRHNFEDYYKIRK